MGGDQDVRPLSVNFILIGAGRMLEYLTLFQMIMVIPFLISFYFWTLIFIWIHCMYKNRRKSAKEDFRSDERVWNQRHLYSLHPSIEWNWFHIYREGRNGVSILFAYYPVEWICFIWIRIDPSRYNWINEWISRCYSRYGRQGGNQSISLEDYCLIPAESDRAPTAIHELMHALGFWHELDRYDRDDYVTINWENIAQGKFPREIKQKYLFLDFSLKIFTNFLFLL